MFSLGVKTWNFSALNAWRTNESLYFFKLFLTNSMFVFLSSNYLNQLFVALQWCIIILPYKFETNLLLYTTAPNAFLTKAFSVIFSLTIERSEMVGENNEDF